MSKCSKKGWVERLVIALASIRYYSVSPTVYSSSQKYWYEFLIFWLILANFGSTKLRFARHSIHDFGFHVHHTRTTNEERPYVRIPYAAAVKVKEAAESREQRAERVAGRRTLVYICCLRRYYSCKEAMTV
jgi:hypothetical protein